MNDFDDDNIFDKDDALDFIIYKEVNKESDEDNGNSGCLGILIILLAPLPLIAHLLLTS